jgi:hypothetical protein
MIGSTQFALPGLADAPPGCELVRFNKTFMDKIVKATIRSAYDNAASNRPVKDLRLLAAEAFGVQEKEGVLPVLVDLKSNSLWTKILDEISGRLATDAANIIQQHLYTHLFDHARYRCSLYLYCTPLLLTAAVTAFRYAVVEPMLNSGTPAPVAVPSKRDEAPAAKACRLAASLVHLVCRKWTQLNVADVRCGAQLVCRFGSQSSRVGLRAVQSRLSGDVRNRDAGRWERNGREGDECKSIQAKQNRSGGKCCR